MVSQPVESARRAASSGSGWYAVLARVGLVADEDGDSMFKEIGRRVGYAGRGLVYVALTISAVKILTGAGQQSQNAKAHKATATVLSWPAGRWLVGAAGLLLIGMGLWNAYRGLGCKFEQRWHAGEMSGTSRRWG